MLISADLYQEFVAPRVERIFAAFGGGSVHFCGNGSQHLETFAAIDHLRVINNSPLGNFDAFTRLVKRHGGKITIQIQDASPVNVEAYYDRLFAEIDDFRGLMLATFVIDNAGMDGQGGYVPVSWDPLETANRIARSVRSSISRRLAGEPTLMEETPARPVFVVEKPAAEAEPPHSDSLLKSSKPALQEVRQHLVAFDSNSLQQAVRNALQIGLLPFDIIQYGMAEGMQRWESFMSRASISCPSWCWRVRPCRREWMSCNLP